MLADDLHHWVTYYRYVPERTAQGSPGMIGLSPWCKLLRVKPGGPAIPAHASLRRPDLIFHPCNGGCGQCGASRCPRRKVQYYDVPDNRNWIARNISSNAVIISSVTLSWRGRMASTSANTLYAALGLGATDSKSSLSYHL